MHRKQFTLFIFIMACAVTAGWYIGTLSITTAVTRFEERSAVQDARTAQLEDSLKLVASDVDALRQTLVDQQVITQKETETLRATIDVRVSELSSTLVNQDDRLTDLATNADIAGLVDVWSPFVYDLTCFFEEEDKDGNKIKNSGSASLLHDVLGVRFVTNAHVTKDDVGGDLVSCELVRDGAETIVVDALDIEISEDEDIDVAYGRVPRNPPAMGQTDICMTAPRIGERVIILGYPTIGAKESVTVTEGIISGFDKDFYTTSAKIESGNSGGAAVSVERNCFLGIPTLVFAGRIESLARILPALSL